MSEYDTAPGKPEFERRKVVQGLTPEQREELARAASEAMTNLALVMPPIIAQLQAVAQVALPALAKAMEPLGKAVKDMELKPGQGEALGREILDGEVCYKCDPPRRIAPGNMEHHNKVVHHGGKDKVPHPKEAQ